ncbi:hypothetical protein FACS1894156_7570 [Bacteroidia bacterium]|nr:hypothetical protein FACS1894156_7570 [Bacteroidia bacterium]
MRARTSKRIFRKIDTNIEQVPLYLYQCYKYEVEQRGREMVYDDATKFHIEKCADWLTNPKTKMGIVLYGKIGSGKTTLALAICRLIGFLYNSPFEDERKFVRKVTANKLAQLSKNYVETFEIFKREKILFIDDVGTEPAAVKYYGNEINPFVDVFLERYDRQLVTILSTNLEQNELNERYGARVANRFVEMFNFLGFENPSYR